CAALCPFLPFSFLSLVQRRPLPTLLPYTTLFRSRLGFSRSNEVRVRDRATGRVMVHSTPDPTAWLTEQLTLRPGEVEVLEVRPADRKSTRLNSSHVKISYAVFCLKKKKNKIERAR